ncbi:hypothetical protein J3R82DRAFT_1528 [Butyriboletus roseoflavus]|nr:hypothetical protein J3R82DRAFT_1528 [Butyriboletus roseoflavus]
MLKSTVSAPTKREFFLIALLLLALLSLSRASIGVRESRASRLVPEYVVQKYNSFLDSPSQDNEIPSTESELWRTRVTWPSLEVPSTTVVSHVPGWTIFDNLFLLNGTVFVVTDDPESVPDPKTITSKGINILNGPEAVASRLPTDREFRIITTYEAQELFGTSADLIDGTTWVVNDPPKFITHYYHWAAELFFGFWRTYSSLDLSISADGSSFLPAVRRIWFVHSEADRWRDYALMNQWVLRSVFPSLTAEYAADWQDRAEMGRPMILDRVVFSDRSAAMHGETQRESGRTAAEAFALPGSVHWWATIRGAVTKFSRLDEGFDEGSKPVITYVSRQEWGRRQLILEDHEKLVQELYKLRDQHGVEVNVVSMDKLSHAEQFRLAGRTTIMMGVHGNGLTSLVWMKPSPKATVIEFFYPKGFARDYEYTTRLLGMVHYGVWNDECVPAVLRRYVYSFFMMSLEPARSGLDRTFTSPKVPKVAYPDGFQGNSIPLNGEVVAKLCRERLQLPASDEH